MKLHLHGKLKSLYGDSVCVDAETVEDALRAVSLQLPDWPSDVLIDVPGYDTVKFLTARTDAEEIHLVPSMYGGGGKFGSIILGAALIAIAIINPGIGGMILSQAGTSLFLSIGASLVLSGVMGLFMKAPKIDRSNDPEASKYLGLNKNTTKIGTPIKLAWGIIPPDGHYLSIQSNSNKLVNAVWPTTPT